MRKSQETIPYVILTISVFAAYIDVYHNDFVLDDLVVIVHNVFLRHWNNLPDLLTKTTLVESGTLWADFHRPVQMFLYFFVYQLFGLSAAAFHGLNVLLQAINTCLVYRLGCRLNFYARASFTAALLWGIHPLHTEAIAYADGTAGPLLVLFSLIGLLVLLPDFTPRKVWLASLFFVLALGSKESAVVFPALATFTLFLTSEERLHPSTYLRTWPLWLLAAVYMFGCLVQNPAVMHDPQDLFYSEFYAHNLVNRMLTSLATLPVYAGLIVWPVHLYEERSFPIFTSVWSWQVLGGVMMVTLAALQIIRERTRARRGLALSWGLLWFAAAQSPNTGIVKPIDFLITESWMYLPTIGIFLGIAQTAVVWIDGQKSKSQKPKRVPDFSAALMILAALSLGAKTYLQNKVWHDHISLYEHAIQCGSTSGRAEFFLGSSYFEQGDYKKSAAHFRAMIAHPAPAWQFQTTHAHFTLALIYLGSDDKGVFIDKDMNKALSSASPAAIEELKETLQVAREGDRDAYLAEQFLTTIQNNKKRN